MTEGLQQVIAEEIRARGPLPFAWFMERCLYHPRYGYYTSGKGRRGKGGDYYTSPTVHPIFGALIARQITQMWQIMGEGAFTIVEMGGGEGYLCRDILGSVQREAPHFYEALRYYMVERALAVIERQKDMLRPHAGKVSWYLPSEMEGMKITGCFLSNELVDSFPVHRVVMTGEGLREIYVDLEEGELKGVQGALSTPELVAYFQRLGITLAEGQQAEVNLEALRWLAAVAKALAQGFVMTIDYGYRAEELYSPLRRDGTLMCYQGHRALTDPYRNPGMQDMTAHVDFTSLIACGEGLGIALTGLVPQYRFLLALGILEQAAQQGLGEDEDNGKGNSEALNERLTIKHLILPGGLGAQFQCLIQHKGVYSPQLDGLTGGESWSARRSSAR
jgi:SAM-dependent MidA family methyltransferase